MPALQAFVEANVTGSTGSPEGDEVRLTPIVRRAALRCALVPVPRDARGRIGHELEEEYPGIVQRRGRVIATLWYARELASIFGWYTAARLSPRRRQRGITRSGKRMMTAPESTSSMATFFGNLVRDARGALRGMRRSVGFTALAVLVLAIGIGANTAVFSIIDWVMLSGPPGVGAPDELVTVRFGSEGAVFSVSHPLHVELRERNDSLAGFTAYASISAHVAMPDGGRTERVAAQLVTETFFDVLDLAMASGRGFRPEEGGEGSAANVVVISDRLRRRWFAAEEAVGREILLSGTPFEIIGVTPEGFHGPEHPGDVDVWVTLASHEASLPHWGDQILARSGGVWMHMVGRLRQGSTLESAQAEFEALAAQVAEEFGDDGGWFRRFSVQLTAGTGALGIRERAASTLRIMSAVVAGLLLLTCANVANMVLARATGRRGEIAVRRALGATRARLVGQLVVENTVLAVLGGVAAVGVALAMVQMFEGARIVSWMPALHDVPVDLRVLVFAFAVSLVSGVAVGLVPALAASRPPTQRRGAAAGSRLRDGLVVAQIALSVTLLIGAGLLARTLVNMRAIDVGIERSHLVFFSIDPSLQGYDDVQARSLVRRVYGNLGDLAGVASVSMGYPEAFGRMRSTVSAAPWGEDLEQSGVRVDDMQVSPSYFETMGIDLVAGRGFAAGLMVERAPARPVVVINERLARRLFEGEAAVGKSLTLGDGRDEPVPYEIVGVARDAHLRRLLDDDADIIYQPFGQRYFPGQVSFPQSVSFQVRSTRPAAAMLADVRGAMLEADPTLPAFDVVSAIDKIEGTIAEHRLVAVVSSALALMALVLAGAGIYGVVATSVRMRFHEIGVRMALGARERDVLREVLGRAAGLGLVGVAIGLLGAWQVAALLQNRLYGVGPFDPPVFAAGAAAMLVLSVLGSLVPARWATRVSPVDVLRRD
jgi:predicted permease